MNGLIRFALGNPRAITVFVLTVILVGAGAVAVIPRDILPSYRSPAVQVLTFYGGMSATNVEADITSRMDTVARGFPNLRAAIIDYLKESNSHVEELYKIDKAHTFDANTTAPESRFNTTVR